MVVLMRFKFIEWLSRSAQLHPRMSQVIAVLYWYLIVFGVYGTLTQDLGDRKCSKIKNSKHNHMKP